MIAALPPAPAPWVQAAIELPRAWTAIDQLAARARDDQDARAAIVADLEQALRGVGVEPRPPQLEDLRARLDGLK
ncbi:MAG: hypothetical protein ACJ780_19590 [Solirubrobacteraceae bacterium]